MSGKFDMSDYVDVAARIAEFRTKHPEGSLRPADPTVPYRVEQIGDKTFIAVVAAAYRSPTDEKPGIGMAWEQFPGATSFTKGSELQNAETSAWGRAIVAALAADTKRGIASAEDVRNRREETNGAQPVASRVEQVMHILETSSATSDDVVAICTDLGGEGSKVNDLTQPQYTELLKRLNELAHAAS